MANYKLKYSGVQIDALLDKINDLEMSNYYTKVDTNELLAGKQDKLIFGSGLSLSESTLSIDDTVVATKTFVGETYATKQDLETIKRNAITLVDTTEYPTLEDFLESTGEEGIVYWYPIDTTDLTKGYHTYVWETNDYIPAGDTTLDLSNYGALSANNTWTGTNNTFTDKLSFVNSSPSVDVTWYFINNIFGDFELYRQNSRQLYFNASGIIPNENNTKDLGQESCKWKDAYIAGYIKGSAGNFNYNTIGYKVFNAPADEKLTDEMFDALKTSGILLKGQCGIRTDITLSKGQFSGNGDIWGICTFYESSLERTITAQYRISQSVKTFAISSYDWLEYRNIDKINNVKMSDIAALITYAKNQGWIS